MVIRTSFSVLLLLIAVLSSAYSQSKADKLDELIDEYAEYGLFNGSVLVAENGKVLYKKGFGLANMEWGIPNQPNTKHRLGSITKQFTAMLIVQLFAENRLKLDVPISTYLPDYPKESGDYITIHHLLTHTSGIPNYTSFPNYRDVMLRHNNQEELVSLFADSALEFTPGKRFEYSNSGYVLLGAIIEKVAEKPYEQVLYDKILAPLEMKNTGYDQNSVVLENRSSGYYKNGNSFVNASYINMSTPYAAGGMYSTVEDLYLWDQALYTEKLLPKKYIDLLFNKYVNAFGQHYGYGWEIGQLSIGNTEEQLSTISHGGSVNGYTSLITRVPSKKSLILLLNNTGGAPLNAMTIAIAGILYDKPYDFPKKSIANSFSDVVEREGIVAALDFYEEVKNSNNYYLNENEMNLLGYSFLQSGRTKEAISTFELNVEAYPNSFNVYDSYGEALLMLGDTNQAIENYKRSMQLNPGNQNGKQVLNALGVNTEPVVRKSSVEQLKLLEGEYLAIDQTVNGQTDWTIEIEEVNGKLYGNSQGYRYLLTSVGDNEFVNSDDGASFLFDTNDPKAITLLIFGKLKFEKVK